MNFTEDQLGAWSSSPSLTETNRMNNAETAIKRAISGSDKLKGRTIKVFAQGSYRNRVNVRSDSDVDICVLCTDTFYWSGGPPGATLESLGYGPSQYSYSEFRTEVGEALRNYFDTGTVAEGDKAFDISGNTYRVEADVAPFCVHKRFLEDGTSLDGVEMKPKSGGRLINWPDQHYECGVAKNQSTSRSFKGCVRILKTLRYRMKEEGYNSAKRVPSFLMECLVYNVPDTELTAYSWEARLRSCLAFLFNNTRGDADCSKWVEVSGYKWLFQTSQPWTRQDAHQFLSDCWDYLGFER